MSGNRVPTFVSLFSGCGGLDLGFTQAGFRCIHAVDVDLHAVSVHRENLKSPVDQVDLSDFLSLPSTWRTADVVLAGPPCQGFSTAGKRDINDPRNTLLVTAAEIAVQLQPKIVLIENVSGVIAGRHKRFWDATTGTLRAGGYRVAELLCDATDFGVFQKRRRLVAIAWRTAFTGRISLPTARECDLRKILSNITGAPNHEVKHLCPSSRAGMIAKRIGPGQKLCNVRISSRAVHTWDIPEVFGRTTKWERQVLVALLHRRRQKRLRTFGDADPVTAQALRWYLGRPIASTLHALESKGYVRRIGKNYDLCHTFNGKFRRLEWQSPAPTVDSKYGDPYYFLHPSEPRAFTVREAARIQGFPDSFTFSGPERVQFQMVGNAVPPPLAKTVADFIQLCLLFS